MGRIVLASWMPMNDISVVAFSYLLLSAVICAIYRISKHKKLAEYDEFRVGLVGCAVFMHLSWLIVYTANINPFVQPEFKAPRLSS